MAVHPVRRRTLALRLAACALVLLGGAAGIISGVPGVTETIGTAFRGEGRSTVPITLLEAAQASSGPLLALAMVCLSCAIASLTALRRNPASERATRAERSVAEAGAAQERHSGMRRRSEAELTPVAAATGVGAVDAARELAIVNAENERLRRTLEACEARLDEAQAAQSRFVSRISHSLRTPMNGILGMSDLLLDSSLNETQQRFVHSIVSSSSGLLSVIDDLLDYARLEVGELRLERARFGLRDALEDVCAAQAPAAHARGIELICCLDDSVPVTVDGDGKRLRQVVSTLVNNALEHTDEGEVVVRLIRESGENGRSRYRCDVQDSGRGISSKMQLALYQGLCGEASGEGRSVLGLAMTVAGELTSRMNGQIRVRSRRGEGSRFSVSFELGDVDGEATGRDGRARLRDRRVLVVDDNRTNRVNLEHQLAAWDMEVETVDGGEAALTALQRAVDEQRPFDVCVLDLNMPGMDGLAFAERAATDARLPDLPCLMLTSSQIGLDAAELDALGIRRNLSKPPRQSELRDTLASLLRDEPARRPVPREQELGPAVEAAPVGTLQSEAEPADAADAEQAVEAGEAIPVGEPIGPASSPDADTVLDPGKLQALRLAQRPGRPDLLARVIDGWNHRTPQLIERLCQARDEDDVPGFQLALRAVQSSAASLGAVQIERICQALEARLPEPGGEPLASLIDEASVQQLEQACNTLREPLQALLDAA